MGIIVLYINTDFIYLHFHGAAAVVRGPLVFRQATVAHARPFYVWRLKGARAPDGVPWHI